MFFLNHFFLDCMCSACACMRWAQCTFAGSNDDLQSSRCQRRWNRLLWAWADLFAFVQNVSWAPLEHVSRWNDGWKMEIFFNAPAVEIDAFRSEVAMRYALFVYGKTIHCNQETLPIVAAQINTAWLKLVPYGLKDIAYAQKRSKNWTNASYNGEERQWK